MNYSLLIAACLLLISCGENNPEKPSEQNKQDIPLTSIQKERAEMHDEFTNNLIYSKIEKKLNYLSKKTFDECTARQADKRLQYSWRLGNIEQLKEDIPLFLESKHFLEPNYFKADWRVLVHFWEHVPSEWYRFAEMADELYAHFKRIGNEEAELKLLGVKIQGAHLLGDTLNEKKYLLQMLEELGTDHPLQQEYSPMLGWWYQDHFQWEESVEVFNRQYQKTKSINMLSSLVWGLFNAGRYREVVTFEKELLKLKEQKINYVLAKSFEEMGNSSKSKDFYEKFRKKDFHGSNIDFYYTERNDSKFYLSDNSYLVHVADYFSETDPTYACSLYKHILDMMLSSLQSNYTIYNERKVILAQEKPAEQEAQQEKYRKRRASLFTEMKYLKNKCKECSVG